MVYNVTGIGNEAFFDCLELTSVTIPNTVTSIGGYAFFNCNGLTAVTIPNTVTSIGYDAFGGCTSLTSVAIPNSVTSIGNAAFYRCLNLTSLTIPNSVTSIGDLTFKYCRSLPSLTIPNSVTSLGEEAFSNCSSLTSVTIPKSVTSIGSKAFNHCSSLASIPVAPENTIYDARDNCNAIIRTSDNTLIVGCQSTTIPASVTSLEGWAFAGSSGLTSVTIPNSVTTIGEAAFGYCENLGKVYCYAETVPDTDYSAFYRVPVANATLHVPATAVNAYQTTDPWSTFGTIKALDPSGINSISMSNLSIRTAAGNITISGLGNSEKVAFYSLNGAFLGIVTATGGTVTFTATPGSIILARIGQETMKIMVD